MAGDPEALPACGGYTRFLTARERAEVERTRFADVIRRNTGIAEEIPDDAFSVGGPRAQHSPSHQSSTRERPTLRKHAAPRFALWSRGVRARRGWRIPLRGVVMVQEPVVSSVPILLKHPILERIDAISRDREKVSAMRDLLLDDADAAALADVAVRHGIVSRALADEMLQTWANVGGTGWLGNILTELRRGVLAAADELLASNRSLSSWWALGLTDDFRLLLVPAGDRLLLFMTTPPLPPRIVFAKSAPSTLDPSFRPALERLRDEIDVLLAPPTHSAA